MVPTEAYFDTVVGFGIENHGVDPDVEVAFSPNDYRQKQDPQLQAAVQEGLRLLPAERTQTAPWVQGGVRSG
jgi:tricorn protease